MQRLEERTKIDPPRTEEAIHAADELRIYHTKFKQVYSLNFREDQEHEWKECERTVKRRRQGAFIAGVANSWLSLPSQNYDEIKQACVEYFDNRKTMNGPVTNNDRKGLDSQFRASRRTLESMIYASK